MAAWTRGACGVCRILAVRTIPEKFREAAIPAWRSGKLARRRAIRRFNPEMKKEP
jgi:hypothetical protein